MSNNSSNRSRPFQRLFKYSNYENIPSSEKPSIRTSSNMSCKDMIPTKMEDLSNVFQSRNLASASRNFPILFTKDGRLIDPKKPDFLMLVVREMDRSLMRSIKDTQLPINYINYRDTNGLTPLSYLCLKGDYILVKMLSEFKGLDVNAPDSEGNTPLMLASQGGHSSVVSFLLERFRNEIDVNKRNDFGFTATMKAALQGRLKCLRSLLNAGANVTLRDPNKGYSALEWAEFCGRKSCAEEIRAYLKTNYNPKSKRLSQAFSDTENWFKSKLQSSSGSGSGSPGSPKSHESLSSLLASASATSTFCASLALLPPNNGGNGAEDELRRPLVVPTIYVTPD